METTKSLHFMLENVHDHNFLKQSAKVTLQILS